MSLEDAVKDYAGYFKDERASVSFLPGVRQGSPWFCPGCRF
jgi:hypothetical protein